MMGGMMGGAGGTGTGNMLMGFLGDAAQTGADYWSAKDLQNDAQDFAKFIMKNRHQLEVRDLRAAGLNPILSATGGLGTGGAGGTGIARPPSSSVGQTSARMAQVSALTSQATKNKAEAMAATSAANLRDVETLRTRVGTDMEAMMLQYYRNNPDKFNELMLGKTQAQNWPQLLIRALGGMGLGPDIATSAKATAKDVAEGAMNRARNTGGFLRGTAGAIKRHIMKSKKGRR